MTLTLLFDLDDTLLDSNIESLMPVYFQKLSAYMADRVPPEAMIRQLFHASVAMYASTRVDRTLEQVFGETFYPALGTTQEALSVQIDRFYDEIFPTLQPLTRPRPEAIALVEWALSQGWKISVATDPLFPRKAILHRLRWAGLAPETYPFSLISDFQTFHFAKAAVSFFPEFLTLLNWDGESPLLMVGDSIERDIVPARKAGIPAFWLKTDGQFAPEAEGVPQGTLADLKTFLASADFAALKPDFSSPSALFAAFRATPALLHHLTLSARPEQWTRRPAPGEWAFTEILCHLRDVDAEVNLPRIETVLTASNPVLTGQVTDPWAEQRGYLGQDGAAAFDSFVAARLQILDKLSALPLSDWERPARHTILGPTTLRELVSFMVEHDRAHIQQAKEALA